MSRVDPRTLRDVRAFDDAHLSRFLLHLTASAAKNGFLFGVVSALLIVLFLKWI